MAKRGGIFKGIFTGGLIGFVAGLLFAPQEGDKTRKKLSEVSENLRKKAEEIKDKTKEYFNP